MQIYRNFPHISLTKPTVITIGNFDGIHRGHQLLLQKTLEIAQQKDLVATVITFYPTICQATLTTLTQKLIYFKSLGIKQVIVLSFNHRIKNLTAAEFLELLKQRLALQHLVVGQNFTFGKNRKGNVAFLSEHFKSLTVVDLLQENKIISSSLIRKELASGHLDTVTQLLGHPLLLRGRLIKQDQSNYLVALNNSKFNLNGKFKIQIENSHYDSTLTVTPNSSMIIATLPPTFEKKMLNFRVIAAISS